MKKRKLIQLSLQQWLQQYLLERRIEKLIVSILNLALFVLLQLLQRLLTDRRRSMNSMMLEGPRLVEAHPGEEGEQAEVKLSTLKQKWEALQRDAEQRSATVTHWQCHTVIWQGFPHDTYLNHWHFVGHRRASLELILPRAQLFQEGVDSLQQWLMSVEQTLAELRNAERVMLHLSEATERAKVGYLPCIIQANSECASCCLSMELYFWTFFRFLSGCCWRDSSQNCWSRENTKVRTWSDRGNFR